MRLKNNYNKLVLLAILVLTVSCVSVSTLDIQVLEPASDPVEPAIRDIVVLNRSVIKDPLPPLETEIVDTTLPESYLTGLINKTTTEAVFSLADILNESPSFNYIDQTRLLEITTDDPANIPEPLDQLFVAGLCDSLEAQALISLEFINIVYTDSLVTETHTEYGRSMRYIRGVIDLRLDVKWRIYEGFGGVLSDEYLFVDTMRWEVADWNIDDVLYRMPEIEEVFLESAYFAALTYARRIAPYWLTHERNVFFRGTRGLRRAYRHLINDEIDNAEEIYFEELNRWNNNIVGAAMHNLALINELKGDARRALVWARRSYQVAQKSLTAAYIDILEERVRISEELDRQLGVN